MKSLTKRKSVRTLQDSVSALLKSPKFLKWELVPIYGKVSVGDRFDPNPKPKVDEKHFSPSELAEAWGVDVETIRNIFRTEPGVLKIGNPGKKRRPYITLRIPREVAERVHRRLAA